MRVIKMRTVFMLGLLVTGARLITAQTVIRAKSGDYAEGLQALLTNWLEANTPQSSQVSMKSWQKTFQRGSSRPNGRIS